MSDPMYVLDPASEGGVRAEPDLMAWLAWRQNTGDLHVGDDRIGDVRVSTIFLIIDHRHDRSWRPGPPILFETWIFGGGFDASQQRYCTHAEALAGHKRWVEYIKSGAKPILENQFSKAMISRN